MKNKFFVVIGLALLIGACGGSSGSSHTGTTHTTGTTNVSNDGSFPPTGKWVRCTDAPVGSDHNYMKEIFDFDQREIGYQAFSDSNCNTVITGEAFSNFTFMFGAKSSLFDAYDFAYGNDKSAGSKVNGLAVAFPAGHVFTIIKLEGGKLYIGKSSGTNDGTTSNKRHTILSSNYFTKQ
jgi:hypothetical protein